MRYEDLTKSQQAQVRLDTCPLCSGKFNKLDDIQEIRMKYGRSTMHFYFHSSCLLGWRHPHLVSTESSQLDKEVEYEEATI